MLGELFGIYLGTIVVWRFCWRLCLVFFMFINMLVFLKSLELLKGYRFWHEESDVQVKIEQFWRPELNILDVY